MNEMTERIFKMAQSHIEEAGVWEHTNRLWVMTGLKEVKRWFGLRSHVCPVLPRAPAARGAGCLG